MKLADTNLNVHRLFRKSTKSTGFELLEDSRYPSIMIYLNIGHISGEVLEDQTAIVDISRKQYIILLLSVLWRNSKTLRRSFTTGKRGWLYVETLDVYFYTHWWRDIFYNICLYVSCTILVSIIQYEINKFCQISLL